MKNQTRYYLFSKNAYAKTGQAKSLKNASTREEAREAQRSDSRSLGIFDRINNRVIR